MPQINASDILQTPENKVKEDKNMRISNVEWIKKRIGFIRKLGEKTARQRQIIELLDNEANLNQAEQKLLHVLATTEKNEIQQQESSQQKRIQERIKGQKERRERNHQLFLAAGVMIDAGLVDSKTGILRFNREDLVIELKKVRANLETR